LAVDGVALAEDLFGESTEFWDVVFVCDGVDVDVVGTGAGVFGASLRAAESEVVEIVD
jgi:hypothetical protein